MTVVAASRMLDIEPIFFIPVFPTDFPTKGLTSKCQILFICEISYVFFLSFHVTTVYG